MQHCEGGFSTNLPLEVVLASNFLLATHFDGQPLEPGHGYPLRAVVGSIPGEEFKTPYFWKGGQVAAGARIFARRPARLLGARRLP